MATDVKKYGEATVSFIQNLYKKINELTPVISKNSQFGVLEEAKPFLEGEIGCKIEIIDANNSLEKKARAAMPQKPGILLE